MKAIRILLIDTTDTIKVLLDQKLINFNSHKFNVNLMGTKIDSYDNKHLSQSWDAILFGENVSLSNITNHTKLFRIHNKTVPILLLTKQSKDRVPGNLKKVGVDDILNIAEINTPLFSWVFMSTLEQIMARKKATEFDNLQEQLQDINEFLSTLTHEINNPLGVIKLALYHLENPTLPVEKRETFFQLLAENVEKIETEITKLRAKRQQLGRDSSILSHILTSKSIPEAVEIES